MPRKNLARRCEPRYGVDRAALEVEATYVAREVDDHLVLSTNELRRYLADRESAWRKADDALRARMAVLPEREGLALRGIIVRDLYHLFELYLTHLGQPSPAAQVATATARSVECVEDPRRAESEVRPLPFSEWLFEAQ